MDFNYLSSISQPRNKIVKSNQKVKTKPNEKKTLSSKVTSNAIQAFLARKEEEERQKYEDARKRKEQLLSLRAQNSKNNKKAKIMASRTKDNDFSKIKLTEDEVEAKVKREKELTKKHLTNTVDRMKARIQLEERDMQLPRTRKRKPNDLKHQSNSSVEIEYKFNGNSVPVPVIVNKKKYIEKKVISKPKSTPVMDYRNLLEIAAKKQFEADDAEYEDFEEESDEYEDDQSEMVKESISSFNTKEDESVHKQNNQNLKFNNKMLVDKHKLKQNKENSYNTNNSLKNEKSQQLNTNHKQLNKSYQKSIPNNKIPKLSTSVDKDSLQKPSSHYQNNSSFVNCKNKASSKPNKYEEYIRTRDDQLHNEEEYIPQYQKPALTPISKSVHSQKRKDSNYIPTNKLSIKSRNEAEVLNNRKNFEQTSFQKMRNNINHNEKMISSNSNSSLDKSKKYLDAKRSVDVSKHKNELFKIPKKKKESDSKFDDNTPCYYTDDNEEKNFGMPKTKSHKVKNHILKQNSEKRQDYSINKKRELESRSLLNNQMNNRIPSSAKQAISGKHNSYIENKYQEKFKNSAVQKSVQHANKSEEPKEYFTTSGEERSKSDATNKSFIKNKHSKNPIPTSTEVYQYFTEDFKKEFTSKNTNNAKSSINNHRINQENNKSMRNAHKLSQNRLEVKRSSYNEHDRINRCESPPPKLCKSETIRNENRINQRIEKSSDQKIVKKEIPVESKYIEYKRFKAKLDNFKREIGKEKVDRELLGRSLNDKLKNEYRTHIKTEKDYFNNNYTEKSKYPEYTSVPKTLQESKSKSSFVQKESAFPKKTVIEKKKIIPPSNMAHLMQKQQIEMNKLKYLEKQRLEKQKLVNGKSEMVTRSENLNRMETNRKILKSNSNSDINKQRERSMLNERPVPSNRYPQSNNNPIPNKNLKFRPITTTDYVGIKRNRHGQPLASMFLRKNIDSDEEDDEEEEEYDDDMADFIDDGPLEEDDEDYSRYIREIFGYDKRRYCYEEDVDDRAMETSYAEQMKEERRSAKIGLLEDLEDMQKEEEEKQQKALKKKR